MTGPALTLHVDSSEKPSGSAVPSQQSRDVVLDDPEVVAFLLAQPNFQAALRDSIRVGVQSLRLAAQPWPDLRAGSFRNVGASPS